ncbi:hypothetical protein L218DRAFT_836488, partial [Marasmius fiardii PR-910]
LAASPDTVKGIAQEYAACTAQAAPPRALSQGKLKKNEDAKVSSTRLDPEEVYLFASPTEDLQPLRSHPHNALLDTFAIGSHSGSNSSSSSGPVTPQTHPVDPEIEVSDMPLEGKANERLVTTSHAAPAKFAVEPGPRHRAPSGSALKPPPRRIGNQLLKKTMERLKALSESV